MAPSVSADDNKQRPADEQRTATDSGRLTNNGRLRTATWLPNSGLVQPRGYQTALSFMGSAAVPRCRWCRPSWCIRCPEGANMRHTAGFGPHKEYGMGQFGLVRLKLSLLGLGVLLKLTVLLNLLKVTVLLNLLKVTVCSKHQFAQSPRTPVCSKPKNTSLSKP